MASLYHTQPARHAVMQMHGFHLQMTRTLLERIPFFLGVMLQKIGLNLGVWMTVPGNLMRDSQAEYFKASSFKRRKWLGTATAGSSAASYSRSM
jgi:hypothetical protein